MNIHKRWILVFFEIFGIFGIKCFRCYNLKILHQMHVLNIKNNVDNIYFWVRKKHCKKMQYKIITNTYSSDFINDLNTTSVSSLIR